MASSDKAPMSWSCSLRGYLRAHPSYIIGCLAFLARLITWILLHLLKPLPTFDSSAEILQNGSATLRWDGIHFAAIAKDGYQYEQQIAFQPGWPLLLRALSTMAVSLGWHGESEIGRIVRIGEIVASASYIGATVMLYKLTKRISTPSSALTTALLYTLSPAPAVMSSAMSEPIFALLTFIGFYFAVKRQSLVGSVFLAGATSVRATGVSAAGPIAWMIIFKDEPVLTTLRRPLLVIRRGAYSILPIGIIISPFLLAQTYFYLALCRTDSPDAWCTRRLPLAYSHIQEKYWNVGLLNYWTIAQIPNLILALPVLLIALTGSYCFFQSYAQLQIPIPANPIKHGDKPHQTTISSTLFEPFIPTTISGPTSSRILLPLYIHSTALTLLLIFSAHTQIALRVCVTDPVVWWSLAGLAFKWQRSSAYPRKGDNMDKARPRGEDKMGMTIIGKIWIWWTLIQGAISIVLWAGHYPPA